MLQGLHLLGACELLHWSHCCQAPLSCCSLLRPAACACKVPVLAALGRVRLRGCAGQLQPTEHELYVPARCCMTPPECPLLLLSHI